MICPTCGAAVPEEARFCSSCGAPLRALSDERRIVTVVFGDVVGFTTLSEARDPEQVKNLLDRCFERLAADVAAFGGRVDKIIGDAIVALFGAPVAHEDDPERAVRAALRMQETMAAHASELDVPFRLRIGVNTGEVLVGALRAGGDMTAMGDVVNTANRLQAAAHSGGVFVGPETYAATRSAIRYRSVGSLVAKGREAPVEAWEALEPLGPPGVRRSRARTPLVGRKAEMGMLWHALGTAAAHRRPHLCLVIGEAGVGKTRLLEEVVDIAREQHDAFVLEGRCVPYGEANVWWPVAEALRQAFDIAPTDAAAEAQEKCRRGVAGVVGTEDEGAEAARIADGLLYLMGYEASLQEVEPARAREEAFRSLQACLTAVAEHRPVVLVLSEMHWADDLILEFVDRLFERIRHLPVVLVATARPELEERWGPKAGRHNQIVLNLDPLDREATEQLVRHLSDRELPAEVRELLVERSGGNPLFLEELLGLMGDAGIIAGATDAEAPELPATLRGLLAARLDALDREERNVLEDAAVGGRNGSLGALAALGASHGGGDPAEALRSLEDKDLLGVENDGYVFKSELVRDVAYETLTKAERARRHAALAAWLEETSSRSGREEEHLERVAYHYGVAAELVGELGPVADVPSDVRERALVWLTRAARRAEHRDTAGVSLHLYDQALRLIGSEAVQARRLFLLGRAKAHAALRDLESARSDATAAMREAEQAGDRHDEARALTTLGDVQTKEGDYETAAATLTSAVAMWTQVGDRQGEAEALRITGMARMFQGDLDRAEETLSRALEVFLALGDRKGEAWCLQNLAWAAFYRGNLAIAEQRLHRSAETFEEIGDFGGRGWALGLLGYVSFYKGDLATAGTIAEGGIEWAQEGGDRWAYGMMATLLANVRLWEGRTSEALDLARRAHDLFRGIDDGFGVIQSGFPLAWSLLLVGRAAEARELVESLAGVAETQDDAMRGTGKMIHAGMSLVFGETEEAMRVLDDEGPLGELDPAQVVAIRGLALASAGRPVDALKALAQVNLDEESDGQRARIRSVQALACAAAGRYDEAVEAAAEVISLSGGTYVDRVLADVGSGLAHAGAGRMEDAERAFADASETLSATEDVMHPEIVRLARGYARRGAGGEEELVAAREALRRLEIRTQGLETIFGLAVDGARDG